MLGGTRLAVRPQQCEARGDAVRASNQRMVTHDLASLQDGAEAGGDFLGNVRAPIGERAAEDDANYKGSAVPAAPRSQSSPWTASARSLALLTTSRLRPRPRPRPRHRPRPRPTSASPSRLSLPTPARPPRSTARRCSRRAR